MDNFSRLMDMLLDRARDAGATAADGVISGGSGHSVSVRLGAVESIERAEAQTMGLRVFVGDRHASISTSSLDEASINGLAERAVSMARLSPRDPYSLLASKEQLATDWPDLDIYDTAAPSSEALRDAALAAEDAARSVSGISNSEGGSSSHSTGRFMLATSAGFRGAYQRSSFSLSTMVIASDEGNSGAMERDYAYSTTAHHDDLENAADIGQRAGMRAVERLGAIAPPTGVFPVIFDNRVSASITGHIAAAINGHSIARGTSFLQDKMGEPIASPLVELIDDPFLIRGLSSSPFDGEGLPRSRRVLIADGVLQGWLLDLSSASQLGLAPTGNASRGIGSPPSPSPTNWLMSAGAISRENLIAGVDDGFLVTELIGSSVSLVSGDYSRGASGFWIKGGRISHPITEATIAGNLKDMLMQITPADDIDLLRSVRVPSLRIDGMTIAGSS